MINGTSMLGKHNPRWPVGNATGTLLVPRVGPPSPRGPSLPVVTGCLSKTTAPVLAWLANLPHGVGSRLFARSDEEARWHGWQVTELARGLARLYRDPRFDTLRDGRVPHDRAEVDGER